MIDLDKYDLIEKYFSGELSSVEREEFDNLVNNDSSFAEYVHKELKANEIVHQLGLLETGNALDKIHKTNKRLKVQKKALATLAITLTIGSLVLFSLNNGEEQVELPQRKVLKKLNLSVSNSSQSIVDKEIHDNEVIKSITKQKVILVPEKPSSEVVQVQVNRDTNAKDFVDSVSKAEYVIPKEELNVVTDTSRITVSSIDTKTCTELVLIDYTSKASCMGEENGSFSFSGDLIKGGIAPYKTKLYRVDDEDFYDLDQLASGDYFLEIIDSDGCVDTIHHMVISEKWCVKRLDVSFSPSYGETWAYPEVPKTESFNVSLSNMDSKEVFNREIIEGGLNWNGQLDDGTVINKGVYILTITFKGDIYYTGTLTVVN